MCAQAKGYVLGRDTAMLCLRIVHQLAAVPVRDHVSEETMHPPNAGENVFGPIM